MGRMSVMAFNFYLLLLCGNRERFEHKKRKGVVSGEDRKKAKTISGSTENS